MSDFMYAEAGIPAETLGRELQNSYLEDPPPVQGFTGPWGSLAVTESRYHGFQPLETDTHLLVVLGGPVLLFRDNKFLTGTDATAGSRALLERCLSGEMDWTSDLSGPFALLWLDKQRQQLSCVTDLLSFIPVYSTYNTEKLLLGSHVDALARGAGVAGETDLAAQADFVLHGSICYPYTGYRKLRQVAPGSVHRFSKQDRKGLRKEIADRPDTAARNRDWNVSAFAPESEMRTSKAYWLPKEDHVYVDIEDAAEVFKTGLEDYVGRVTEGMSKVAQFLSGGEDSRALAGLLPQHLVRDGFVFLDGMNREGALAKKAAEAYGLDLQLGTRSPSHYLDLLPAAASLVGRGSLYLGLHFYGFHKSLGLTDYPAVSGGLYADALFKGSRIKKDRWSSRYSFVPQRKDDSYSPAAPLQHSAFAPEVLAEVQARREEHLERVQRFRRESAEEWFELWPASMNLNMPNLHGNRRLFRSYEPFLCHELVKLSARLPQEWKLNRRFFHRAVRPWLKPSKWLLHGDGRLPYFPWYVNSALSFKIFLYRKLRRRLGMNTRNEEPWADWNALLRSPQWQEKQQSYAGGIEGLQPVFKERNLSKIMNKGGLGRFSKFALLQEMYYLHRPRAEELEEAEKA